jgi:lipopolysaccharide export system permease protein
VLELQDGEIHDIPADEGGVRRYRRLTFKSHVINIPGAGGMLERTVREVRGNREMGATMLLAQRDTTARQYAAAFDVRRPRLMMLGLPTDQVENLGPHGRGTSLSGALQGAVRRGDPYATWTENNPELRTELDMWKLEREAYLKRMAGLTVEVHKKFSLPFACVVFVLIGAPIGMRVRRTGPAIAFLSVLFFLFYWFCLIGGEELANRLLIPPGFAMWMPNLLLGLLGLDWTLLACEIRVPWHRRPERRPTPSTAVAHA